MTRIGPNFFIVGAPKCGTTALDSYLRQHPQIFMGRKERHYFGSDLDEIWRQPSAGTRPTPDDYFGMFGDAAGAVRRGEASVWYLWSHRAAQEIHAYDPDARVIVMLRNPVDMLASLHSQYVYSDIEDLEDFAEAIAAEPDRRAGRRIPPNNGPQPWRLFYTDIARFHDQVQRYLTVFGRSRVHITLFDDLARNAASAYREVLEFLEVDPDFRPEFAVVNANKRIRSRWLQHRVLDIYNPESRLRRIGMRMIPIHSVRSALLSSAAPVASRLNTARATRSPVDPALRAVLSAELADDVRKLGTLIDRDLEHWTRVASPVQTSPVGALGA